MYRTNEIPTLTQAAYKMYIGAKEHRTLAHNTDTWVTYRGGPCSDVINVQLHGTRIAQLIGKYLVLDTGGWWSVTTLQRMNKLLPVGIGVHTVKGERCISSNGIGDSRAWSHTYHDGIILDIETGELVLREIPSTVAYWLAEVRTGRNTGYTAQLARWGVEGAKAVA